MQTDNENVRSFGMRDKVGYMFGDFGNDFTFIFASSFLMVFYTKILGISGGAVGTLFLVARFVDAITDVTMGRVVDAARTAPDGKFKCWIRRMCGPVALASFLMYQTTVAQAPMGWLHFLYVCDVSVVGKCLLYIYQHPLWLDGFGNYG